MEEKRRAETGPMQFGDDWPGVFIRGDNAMFFATALDAVLRGDASDIARSMARGLLSELVGCDVRQKPAVTKLRAFGECAATPGDGEG